MSDSLTRRDVLVRTAAMGAGACAAAAAGELPAQQGASAGGKEPFRYCLNTSTIREQKLSVPEQLELAAKAGYQGVEPWLRELEAYRNQGGSLADLKKRIDDLGLAVPSAIGFAAWIVDDAEERRKGLEQAKRDMDLLAQIGAQRIAAPPVGATNQTDLDLFAAARRYRALVELGEQMGVIPQVEVWGFSKSLSRLGETALVAIESGHRAACILPDVYHIYKGGSDFAGLGMLSGAAIHVFHANDYPADPPRDRITDAERVYPGDGVAPLGEILRMVHAAGFRGYLSLELFNPNYWKQDAMLVARTGLEKMREAVQRAFS